MVIPVNEILCHVVIPVNEILTVLQTNLVNIATYKVADQLHSNILFAQLENIEEWAGSAHWE